MSYFQAIFLAVVQGLTEFLPVSSSGHLVIFQKFFGLGPPVLFDILVHVGTLGAIIFYLRKRLALKKSELWRVVWLVTIGTVPAVILGLFFRGIIEQIFNSLRLVGVSLLVTSGLLFSTRWVTGAKKQFKYLKWTDALAVGLFQALAILPGISRSGSTIVSGLWRRLDPEAAFQFSFLLAIPAVLGALVLQIPNLVSFSDLYLFQGLLGMLIAGGVGYLALAILEKILREAKFFYFGFYCLVLGLTFWLI